MKSQKLLIIHLVGFILVACKFLIVLFNRLDFFKYRLQLNIKIFLVSCLFLILTLIFS